MGKREADTGSRTWTGVMRGVVTGALAAVFLLGVCAVLVTMAVIPEGYMSGCIMLVCAVGTLIGGRVAVGMAGKRTVLWGLCVGLATAALFGVSGFLLYGGLELQRCIAVSCACLCGGGASGVLGRRVTRKRRA